MRPTRGLYVTRLGGNAAACLMREPMLRWVGAQRRSSEMTITTDRPTYRPTVRELPLHERPRERLERYGAATLQTSELLASIFGSGTRGENVVDLSTRLLREFGGLGGLLSADVPVLCAQHGLGPAKALQLKATLELGRRLSVLAPDQRPQITCPGDVASLAMLCSERRLPGRAGSCR